MAIVASEASVRSTVEQALEGPSGTCAPPVRGRAARSLLLSLAVLLALLWSVLQTALPVFAERGFDFVTSNMSRIESRAGVRQALIGSLLLIAFVFVVPSRSGSRRRSTCRSTRRTRS